MRKWLKRIGWFLLALVIALPLFLTLTPMGRDITKIARASGDLQGATFTDTQLFQPQVAIGESCTARDFAAVPQTENAKLAAALAKAQAYSEEMQGVGLIVVKDGALLHESYAGKGAVEQSVLSFSMHKSLVALVVGIAIEDGTIGSLSDPVGNYIEEWADDPRGAITIRQLLNTESGLELTGLSTFTGMRMSLGDDINAIALNKPLSHDPGSKFEYNNATSQILGIALNRALVAAGHEGYAAYLEQKLWCPAGNDEAALWYDREVSDGGTARYYAGSFSNLRNWARIGEVIQNKGAAGETQLVPAAWIAAMSEPAPTNPNYGLHVWLDAPDDGTREYSKSNPIAIAHSAP